MPDSLMYREDTYVVLESNQPEQFMSATELLEKLKRILAERQEDLPRDLQKFSTLEERSQHLLNTYCEFNTSPENLLQWYAVRLEK
ncbi:MAG: chlororespiratory reduction protein 7 [Okeania sp. SIO2H7]|nr:chlororespiratory reduction protein 7 [Okeania sp. SIO2H7]